MQLRSLKRFFLKLLRKDLMQFDIEGYRKSGMKIGGCRIFSRLNTDEPYLIEIGDRTTISTGVSLITHDNSAIKVFSSGTDFVGEIKIGRDCFIGANTTILPGVSIAPNVIVGAGSVVTKSFLTAGVVIAGNPARIVGSVSSVREKYSDNVFDFSGERRKQKKDIILNNPERYIKK